MKRVCVCVCTLLLIAAAAVTSVLVWYYYYRKQSFQEIILRRCSRYSPPPNATLRVVKDCGKIEEAFTNAFISKDPCHIREEDYQPLMMLMDQKIPRDKVLFWSKTEELTHDYKKAGGRLLLMRELLVGHIADKLTWCGKQNSSEVKLRSCPERSDSCPHPAAGVFWNVSSKWFAENTHGKVHVLLNGSISDTYSETSVFRSVEVPNLSSDVHVLHAWVICEELTSDSCSCSSIKELESDVSKKGIVFTCENMDRDTFLQCVKNPEGSQCKSIL